VDVVVIGATGRCGRLLVGGALKRGHTVTAFVRDRQRATAILGVHERLRVACGDLLEPRGVSRALAGADAVVFAAGPRNLRGRTQVASQGMVHVVHAMRELGQRRLVCISAGGTSGEHDPNAPWFYDRVVKPLLLQDALADLRHMEVTVRQSGLDWTIVRAPRLTNRKSKRYRVGPGYVLSGGRSVTRAALADFILSHLERDEYRGHAVAIASQGAAAHAPPRPAKR
jgi:putative NADH-flavin reductase